MRFICTLPSSLSPLVSPMQFLSPHLQEEGPMRPFWLCAITAARQFFRTETGSRFMSVKTESEPLKMDLAISST